MPVGFIFLGIVLIYVLFFVNNKTLKSLSVIFCVFTMCGYFVKPLNLGNVSVNLIITIASIILLIYFFIGLNTKQKFNLVVYSVIVSLGYVVLTIINSDFITTLNPYPVCFAVLVLSVLNLNNVGFVISLTQLSFLLISLCNLFVERGLTYVNFASVEFFNLMLVSVVVVLFVKLCVTNLKIFQRRKQ